MTKIARKASWAGTVWTVLIGLLIVIAAGYGAYLMGEQKAAALLGTQQAMAQTVARGPKVQVITVTAGPRERLIRLLGDARPMQTVTLYSKLGGYLKSIHVDRGDMVTNGQIIAEIDSPETQAQLRSATTDFDNKRRNAKRARDLVASGARSLQSIEQAEADASMAEARVAELTNLASYGTIRAPFDGRITARFTDPGALVQNATTNQTAAQPLVTLVDDRRLRINVYVEQRDVPHIKVGDVAEVRDGADSTRMAQATIARTSGQLDPRTRTLFVELEVDNTDRFLVPGSFAYVTLHVPIQSFPEIPVAGLIVRGANTYAAMVNEEGLIQLKPVKVATTDGLRVRLVEGLRVGDRIALNLPDEVGNGGRVQAVLTR
ncbi:MAG: efflux RND transporter periplasmic adaptor subunit [Acetobacteraceae bacterium]|nr:efflux RND transporter periplasmic adaptor subunit [Acetobacteraceae bacterium]MSP30507.1 efflux RND transporter periplasmic adaptor subunit [Acetobacteraceae bacterium]